MDLFLTRKQFRIDGIFGEIRDESGALVCVTIEHAYVVDDGVYSPKIPQGEFKCQRGMHQLHSMVTPFETFEVTGVMGHSNILFHCGNTNKDSEGCILLGSEVVELDDERQAIAQSKEAFAKFMALENGLDSFTLTVRDDSPSQPV